MIVAVEVRKGKWDLSCANDQELFRALTIDCDKLDIKFIDFAKLTFGGYSPDINRVIKALSKKNITLISEAMPALDEENGNSRQPALETAGDCSDESLMAMT